ncbi:oligosaccharide flippase family protein [Lentilactobacillus rapi]|uniref:oligosaccharide flippase family protein n=1 Tax=Lentilactobacillus rapi TaxID=481723 RepID=UPI003BF5D2EA
MFLLIPFLSSWRGYFQGKLDMKPTAYSQVVEQVIRVTVILAVAFWAARSLVNPYKMGTIAMLSAPIAGLAALMIVRSWVKKSRYSQAKQTRSDSSFITSSIVGRRYDLLSNSGDVTAPAGRFIYPGVRAAGYRLFAGACTELERDL